MNDEKQMEKSNLSIPGAIIVVGILIAGAILLSNKSSTPAPANNVQPSTLSVSIKPVGSTDHILGDPNAPITIVEYSDPSCPYCKLFQSTMESIMSNYGTGGKVAWVYRDFPLTSIHPNAEHEAEAFECVASIGGNNTFWAYEEKWYSVFPLQGATDRDVASDTAQLTQVANETGIDTSKFTICLSSGVEAQTVENDYQNGVTAGAQGTPYSVMILKTALTSDKIDTIETYISDNNLAQNVMISSDNKEIVLNGAIPLANVTPIIDTILK